MLFKFQVDLKMPKFTNKGLKDKWDEEDMMIENFREKNYYKSAAGAFQIHRSILKIVVVVKPYIEHTA